MKLFVGLGNPGPQYTNHRHNIGFKVIDFIASLHPHESFKPKFKGLLSEIIVNNTKILLFKPQNFMNLSGQAVAEVIKFYKIPLTDLHVFHDDLDIKLTRIKYKFGGSPAGHNGIRNIDHVLGNLYNRIRIGIEHPGHRDLVTAYVLSDFRSTELESVASVVEKVSLAVPLLLQQDYESYVKVVNGSIT